MRYFITILVCMAAFTACAQSLKGVVVDRETGEPLYSVTIVNTLTREATFSNEQGEFTINAKAGTPIAFTMLGYENTKHNVPYNIGVAMMRVEMDPVPYKLGEILIRPGYTPYQADSVRRHSTYQRALAREKTTSIMSPVSLLAEKLSGKSKQVYNFQKNFNKWESERFIDSRYTPEMVTQLTGLKGDSLGQFMVAYPMPYDYARKASELELQMWVRYNYKQWMKLPLEAGKVPDTMADKQ